MDRNLYRSKELYFILPTYTDLRSKDFIRKNASLVWPEGALIFWEPGSEEGINVIIDEC